MRSTPSSTVRRSSLIASTRSRGSPHIPGPVIRIAPNPSRVTAVRPPSKNTPLAAAVLPAAGLTFAIQATYRARPGDAINPAGRLGDGRSARSAIGHGGVGRWWAMTHENLLAGPTPPPTYL